MLAAPPHAICALGMNHYGVIWWQDKEDDNDEKDNLEESDADTDAATRYIIGMDNCFLTTFTMPLGFSWQLEVAAIGLILTSSVNWWMQQLPKKLQWEKWICDHLGLF